jgi:hypothetical protein
MTLCDSTPPARLGELTGKMLNGGRGLRIPRAF